MKKLLLLLSVCFLLLHCDSKPVAQPDDLISEEQMVDILYDLHVINAIKSSGIKYGNQGDITAATYIYKKYDIDSLQFAQSDRYYATDINEYESMYQEVTQRLQKNKAAIDALIAKNPEVAPPKEPILNEKRPNGQDSLPNKQSIRSALFKDGLKKN